MDLNFFNPENCALTPRNSRHHNLSNTLTWCPFLEPVVDEDVTGPRDWVSNLHLAPYDPLKVSLETYSQLTTDRLNRKQSKY